MASRHKSSPLPPSSSASTSRFRVSRPQSQIRSRLASSAASARQLSLHVDGAGAAAAADPAAFSSTACERCRRQKKKCSRNRPTCEQCTHSAVDCTYAELSLVARLEERVEQLTHFIKDALDQDVPAEQQQQQAQDGDPGSSAAANPTTSPESTAIVVGGARGSVTSPASASFVGGDLKAESLSSLPGPALRTPLNPELDLRASGRSFVDAYFRHVHRVYPFVDKASILECLQGPDDPISPYDFSLATTKLYLIMAIGCTTLERAGEIPLNTSPRFKIRYSMVVDTCLKASTVESVETLFLLSIYSLFDPVGMSPWSLVGILTRQAMAVGITRRLPKTEQPPLSPYQSELRHRLYWSVFVLDRMLSTSLGLPVGLTDENCDIPLPGITIEEFDTGDRLSYTTSLQICRHVIQLRQLEESILRATHLSASCPKPANSSSMSSSSSAAAFDRDAIKQDFRGQVDDWYSQGCLLSAIENDNLPFHNTITWLTVRYYNLLILLYSPSKLSPAPSPQERLDLQVFAQKYLQSSSILLQQRQLPLNWNTLYRLLSICSTLLYCFVQSELLPSEPPQRGSSSSSTFISRDEISLCADMLESFPPTWAVAARAADTFRQFATLASSSSSSSGNNSGDDSGLGPELRYKWFVHVRGASMRLAQDTLGRSSAFCFTHHHLVESSRGWAAEPDVGGRREGADQHQHQQALPEHRSSRSSMGPSDWDAEPGSQPWRYGADYF